MASKFPALTFWIAMNLVLLSLCSLSRAQDLPDARSIGTPDVPMDSWVYPTFERLSGRGLIHTQFLGLRPWTRFACAMLTREAKDSLAVDEVGTVEAQLIDRLGSEFRSEIEILDEGSMKQVQLESLYTRVTGIAGTPLNDSFHFGQTVINDYGRPYGDGASAVTGFSGSGQVGAVFGSLRAEYQHSPGMDPYSASTQSILNKIDGVVTSPLLSNRPN